MPIEKYIKAREKTKSPEFRKKLYEIREKQKEQYAKREAKIAAGEISRFEKGKEIIKKLAAQKLKYKQIVKKGKRPTVVINVPSQQMRSQPQPAFKQIFEEDRRQF